MTYSIPHLQAKIAKLMKEDIVPLAMKTVKEIKLSSSDRMAYDFILDIYDLTADNKKTKFSSYPHEECDDPTLSIVTNATHYLCLIRNFLLDAIEDFEKLLEEILEKYAEGKGCQYYMKKMKEVKERMNLYCMEFHLCPDREFKESIPEKQCEEIANWARIVWEQDLKEGSWSLFSDYIAEVREELTIPYHVLALIDPSLEKILNLPPVRSLEIDVEEMEMPPAPPNSPDLKFSVRFFKNAEKNEDELYIPESKLPKSKSFCSVR